MVQEINFFCKSLSISTGFSNWWLGWSLLMINSFPPSFPIEGRLKELSHQTSGLKSWFSVLKCYTDMTMMLAVWTNYPNTIFAQSCPPHCCQGDDSKMWFWSLVPCLAFHNISPLLPGWFRPLGMFCLLCSCLVSLLPFCFDTPATLMPITRAIFGSSSDRCLCNSSTVITWSYYDILFLSHISWHSWQ